jgi:TrmH family RNA methyltransferase
MPSSPFPPASRTQQKSWARLLQSKYRVREGRFLAEGVKVVEELIQSGWPIEAVIVRTDKEPYWSRLPLPERIPVYQLSQADFKRLSQDKEPEGVIAVTHIKKPPEIQSILEETGGRLLVAHEMSNPQNLGALLRTARWFGFTGLILGTCSVDWTHPKAVRASMGTIFSLPVWPEVDLAAFLPQVKKRYRVIAGDAREGTAPRPISEDAALLLGSESHGLPQKLLRLADERWRIPAQTQTEWLSLPQAAAIMMYELSKK